MEVSSTEASTAIVLGWSSVWQYNKHGDTVDDINPAPKHPKTMGSMASSLLWVVQNLYHQPYHYNKIFRPLYGMVIFAQTLQDSPSFSEFRRWRLQVRRTIREAFSSFWSSSLSTLGFRV